MKYVYRFRDGAAGPYLRRVEAVTLAYRDYEEIAQLQTHEQRRVLQAGDAVERVWAAWALRMRLGRPVLPDLLSTLDESPDPGTRRHLLVVLAGLGEDAVLRVFAADDPDEYVRATACQYLIRTGNLMDRDLSGFLRERALSDHSAAVKRDLLAELPEGFAVLSPVELARLAGDEDLDLRSLAIERLVADLPLDQLIPGPLADRIEREQNPNLRHHLLEMGIRMGGAARLGPERCGEFLDFLAAKRDRVDWALLAPLAALAKPSLDVLVVPLIRSDDRLTALPWLLSRLADHGRSAQTSVSAGLLRHGLWLLFDVLPELEGYEEGSLARDAVSSAIAYLEEIPDPFSADDDWEDMEPEQAQEEMELYRQNMLELIAALKRAAGMS